MSQQYRASEGDTLDYIAWKVYGTQGGQVVEKLVDANPGLADLGPQLPAGTIVTCPAIDTTQKAAGVRLWD